MANAKNQIFRQWLAGKMGNRQQKDIAIEAGIGLSTVYNVLHLDRIPDETTLTKLARALEIDENEMLMRAGIIPPDSQKDLAEYLSTHLQLFTFAVPVTKSELLHARDRITGMIDRLVAEK